MNKNIFDLLLDLWHMTPGGCIFFVVGIVVIALMGYSIVTLADRKPPKKPQKKHPAGLPDEFLMFQPPFNKKEK